jgi:glycine/D-amino acid oxidase-like deaminating enzyme
LNTNPSNFYSLHAYSSRTKLYTQTGGLDFGSENHHMMQKVIQVAIKNQLEHEILNAEQIKKRFPAFNKPTFQNDYIGLYQPDAGILNAAECVSALQVLALRNKNITLRDHQQVLSIQDINHRGQKMQQIVVRADAKNLNVCFHLK